MNENAGKIECHFFVISGTQSRALQLAVLQPRYMLLAN